MSRRHSDPGPEVSGAQRAPPDLLRPHPRYPPGTCAGFDPKSDLHLYRLHKNTRDARKFREDLESDLVKHRPVSADFLADFNYVRFTHVDDDRYVRNLQWFKAKVWGFKSIAVQDLVSPTGWHSGFILMSKDLFTLVVRFAPVRHDEWLIAMDKELLSYLRGFDGLLASGGTLQRLWQADLNGFDMVRTTVETLAFPSRHWPRRYDCSSAVDLGVWAPHEILWGEFVGYVQDEQQLGLLNEHFPQRSPITHEATRSLVTSWKANLTGRQKRLLFNTCSGYWATFKLQLAQYFADGIIDENGGYQLTFLAYSELKVEGKVPKRRLPDPYGSEESNHTSPSSIYVERARALTAEGPFPDLERDEEEEMEQEIDPSGSSEPTPTPVYPLGEPLQPNGLEVADPVRLSGREHQQGRGGRYNKNWDPSPLTSPEKCLPEKYRSSAVLANYCPICGSREHSKKACPILFGVRQYGNTESIIRCQYPLCKKVKHRLEICPVLHARCTCGCRGHTAAECRDYTTAQKASIYYEFRPEGAGLKAHLHDPDWEFPGPDHRRCELVPVYTPHAGYLFVEPEVLPYVCAATTEEELKKRIHAAHFH